MAYELIREDEDRIELLQKFNKLTMIYDRVS